MEQFYNLRKVYQTQQRLTNIMHINNCLFSNPQPQTETENEPVCLVLTDFPKNVDLSKTVEEIQQEFSFITKIKIIHNSEIECFFDSMTDLIELDHGIKYGAGRAFIRHFAPKPSLNRQQSNFQKQKAVFQNSRQTFASDTQNINGSYKFIPSLKEGDYQTVEIDPKLRHRTERQRLTSLENQIEQIQHLREVLYLFKDNQDHDLTFQTDQISKSGESRTPEKNNYSNVENCIPKLQQQKSQNDEISDYDTQVDHKQHINKKYIVFSLLEGAVLTGLIVGGIKLFKNILR